jgi:hypothetical protein
MTRTPNDRCLLCQTENSTKKNSHIVPKFITKSILGTDVQKKGYIWDTGGKRKKPTVCQDTSKEDYILCPSCEKYFEILETYVSKYLHTRIQDEKYNDNFSFFTTPGNIDYAKCLKSNSLVVKLFFLSIYWRCSITTKIPFTDFQINEEEQLRISLLRHKTQDIKELLIEIEDKKINDFSLVVIRSTNQNDQTNNFMYAQVSEDNTYGLVFNEYITFFAIEETPITRKMISFANKNGNQFLVILGSGEFWLTFKNMIIEHFRDLKSKSLAEIED